MSGRRTIDSLRPLWVVLSMAGTACSFAGSPAQPADGQSDAVHQERLFRTPGGQTRIESWTNPDESVPRTVRAQRYVSGMSLASGISLVFHAADQGWKLSLNGQLTPLRSLATGNGPVPLLAADTPIKERYAFDHEGRRWQLVILSRQEPAPLSGVATEQEHSLDLLLWSLPPR